MNSDMTITAHFEKNQGASMWWLIVAIIGGLVAFGVFEFKKSKK